MIYKKDLNDEKAIVLHFRDLILFSKLLDYDVEMGKFIVMLKEYGYSEEKLRVFIKRAGEGTFFEKLIDYAIPEIGDRTEFEKNRDRYQK